MVNSPIEPNYSYPIPTLCIGELKTQTPANATINTTPAVIAFISLSAGVWMLNGSFKCAASTASAYTWGCITTSGSVMSANGASSIQQVSATTPPILNTTLFISINSGASYNLLAQSATSQIVTNIYLSAVRVA